MSWYKKLGLIHNPFTIKPKDRYFIEKSADGEKVLNLIEAIDDFNFAVIRGKYGLGKTTLLKNIIRKYGGRRKVVYYNSYATDMPIDFDMILINAGNFFMRLFRIKSNQIILILDESQNLMMGDYSSILDLHSEGYIKSAVFITSDIKFKFPDEITKYVKSDIELSMFSEDQALSIVDYRLGKMKFFVPDEIIKELYKMSATPREFLMNCEDACRAAVTRGAEHVEKSDLKSR